MGDLNHYFISSILGGRMEAGSRPRFGFLQAGRAYNTLEQGIARCETPTYELTQQQDVLIADAFESTRNGYSVDVVLSVPELSLGFFNRCRSTGVDLPRAVVNRRLMRFRKSPPPWVKLRKTTREYNTNPGPYVYAAEIAMAQMRYRHDATVDDLLVDPDVGREFVQMAAQIRGDGQPVDYITAALYVRKNRKPEKDEWARIEKLKPSNVEHRLHVVGSFSSLTGEQVPSQNGLFVISEKDGVDRSLYVGCGRNLRLAVAPFHDLEPFLALGNHFWKPDPNAIFLRVAVMDTLDGVDVRGWQCRLIHELHPVFNYPVKPYVARTKAA